MATVSVSHAAVCRPTRTTEKPHPNEFRKLMPSRPDRIPDTGPKPLWTPDIGVPDEKGRHITPAIRERIKREDRRRPTLEIIDDDTPTEPFRRIPPQEEGSRIEISYS